MPRSSSGSTRHSAAVARVCSSSRWAGVPPEARGLHDPLGGAQHAVGVLQPGLAGVQLLGRVDGHQTAGGVQDVGDRAEAGVGVPDGVAEHRADPLFGGESDGTGGKAQGAGSGAGPAVPDGLQAQGVAIGLPPGDEEPGRAVRPAGGEGAADVGAGAEQQGQTVAAVVLPGQHGGVRGGVGGGDETAQVGPAAGAVAGEEGDTGCRLVDEGTSADRGAALLPADRLGGGHRQVHPEQRTYARLRAGLGEADRTGEGVAVGEGEGVHAPLRGALGEPLRVGGAVAQGEPGDGVQMRETRHTHLPHSSVRTSPPDPG
ncbi:hypothetical protein RKD18_002235 [Streptomyces phaeoluteigriseus]